MRILMIIGRKKADIFFIMVNGKLAGLVLVRSCCEHNTLPNPHCIAEFFVMKKYRQKGVGTCPKLLA